MRTRRWALAFGAMAALGPAVAVAHDSPEDGVDLEALEMLCEARLEAAEGSAAKLFKKALKALDKEDRPGVGDDLGKIKKTLRFVSKLPTDEELLDACAAAAAGGNERLTVAEPDALADLVQQLRKAAHRSKVEKAGTGAVDLRVAGKAALDRGDVADAVKLLGKAAKRFSQAEALARRLIKKQGGGLPQFKTATARTVYTVVGTGAGGFNGDRRAARRSSLYFVCDTTIGPDGRLYVVDWNNHRIRVRESDGSLAPVCGSGTPGDSEGAADATELNHPSQVVFAPDGKLLIAAWHNHKIKVFDAAGNVVRTIAGGGAGNSTTDGIVATDARFNLVPGLLLLPQNHPLGGGDLLLTDATNARVMCVRLGTRPEHATNVAGVEVDTGDCDRVFGTGVPGYSGDGQQAHDAQFEFSRSQNAHPDGRMAIDAAGNVYICMGVRHVVRKVATDGTVTTFAGTGEEGSSGDGGLATEARLGLPSDVCVLPDGSVCISDATYHVIRRVTPDGKISTYAGQSGVAGYGGDDGPAGSALFDEPSGLECDANGNLYVADRGNHVVRVVTSDTPGDVMLPVDPYTLPEQQGGGPPPHGEPGTIDTLIGSGTLGFNGDGLPSRATHLYWPQDVGVQPVTGLVHFLDWNNHRVRRLEDDGTITTVVGSGELGDDTGDGTSVPMNHPTDLTFDPLTGDLWIAAWHTDKVLRLDGVTSAIVYMAGGKRGFGGDGADAAAATLSLPSSVKFDSDGNWYVGDEGNRRVRRVERTSNVITTLVGTGEATDPNNPLGDDGPADLATLNLPVGQSAQPGGRVCIDPTDRYLYVADTDNGRVRRVDLQTHVITTVAGGGDVRGDGGPATSAKLRAPVDVDCDAAGNVYVVDRDDHSVRKVDVGTGTITTLAGGGVSGYSGDGGLAVDAHLNRPGGLFVDRTNGRIYVADTYNGVVRVIWE